MTEDALLAQLRANRDDREARAVLLDFERDRGNTARVAFLEADARIAPMGSDDPGFEALERTLEAAAAELEPAWLTAIRPRSNRRFCAINTSLITAWGLREADARRRGERIRADPRSTRLHDLRWWLPQVGYWRVSQPGGWRVPEEGADVMLGSEPRPGTARPILARHTTWSTDQIDQALDALTREAWVLVPAHAQRSDARAFVNQLQEDGIVVHCPDDPERNLLPLYGTPHAVVSSGGPRQVALWASLRWLQVMELEVAPDNALQFVSAAAFPFPGDDHEVAAAIQRALAGPRPS